MYTLSLFPFKTPFSTKVYIILKRIDTIHVEKYNTKLPSSNRRKEQLKELFESSVSAKDAMDQFFKDLHDGLFICSTESGLALEIFQRRSDYILEKNKIKMALFFGSW